LAFAPASLILTNNYLPIIRALSNKNFNPIVTNSS
jgi:hypothetical protein